MTNFAFTLITTLLALVATATNDTYYTSGAQWYLNTIQAEGAWNVTTGSEDVIVAVLDTGVNANHPELAGRVLEGYDFVNNDADASDDNGHGTAVAGLITANSNNNEGVAGIAWNLKILPVKVLNNKKIGGAFNIANGIKYATDAGARIINLSLSTASNSKVLQDAINYAWSKGVVIVAASGNKGDDTPRFPAAWNNVLSVGASTVVDTLATYSNHGSTLDILAPGSSLIVLNRDGGFKRGSGTSYSTALVSGLAGLIATVNPNLTNQEIIDLIIDSSDDLGTNGFDNFHGFGRINAKKALDLISPATTTTTQFEIVDVTNDTMTIKTTVANNVTFSVETSTDMNNWETLGNFEGTGTAQVYEIDTNGSNGTIVRLSLDTF